MDNEQNLNVFEYYTLISRSNVLVSYKGPITDVILAEISRDIKSKFAQEPAISRKLFAIFIELAQNILYYSAEKAHLGNKQDGIGLFLLRQTSTGYLFSFGNVVENKYVEILSENVEKINSMSHDELRAYKRRQRSSPAANAQSKGAGFGLVQVAITAGTPLVLESTPTDEQHSFLILSIQINKETGHHVDQSHAA